MIKKFRAEIGKIVNRKLRAVKDQARQNQQTHFSYSQISQLFKEDTFIPFSAWAISPITILHVLNDISINGRKNIIEFGAGASTFYIAKLIKVLNLNAVFFSVESNEKWAMELQRQLAILKLDNYVTIIYSPLKEVPKSIGFKDQSLWYDIEILNIELVQVKQFDLVLIDGPFGASSPYARYSAIPFLKNKLENHCSIFLDDINRPHEKEIANAWKEDLNLNLQIIDRYGVFNNYQNFDVMPLQLISLPL